jgi:hypothetical protein
MKKSLKMFTVSAATVLTLTFASQSFAATPSFNDLGNIATKDKIITLQQKGYVHGISSTRFLPNATITAAQGVQLIVNALGLNIDTVRFLKEPQATDYFANASNDAWYENALIIAAVNDIGLPADLDPDKLWTREEFTHQLILAIEKHSNLPMIKLMPVEIGDQADLTIDYDGSVQRALVLKIANLDAEGNFNPKAEITRAESAELIYNALQYIEAHPAPTQELAE